MIVQKIKDFLEESNSIGNLVQPEELLELISDWEIEEAEAK